MKEQYEHRARTFLPRRTFTILRLDGRAFHSYTRGLDRPFDQRFMDDMATTAKFLCEEVSRAAFAYTQSDEISLLLTDFATNQTEAWFGGNVQKMVSISAAIATARFNELRPGKLAMFDSRAFTIPDPTEVANYFVWRQKDATRNSISMAAQAFFGPGQLHGVSCDAMQEMLFSERGINWNDYPDRFKRGTLVATEIQVGPVTYINKRTNEERTTEDVERRTWTTSAASIFTQTDWLKLNIPEYG
jgi:tRNA(His) 5'-end guanylyltransferase